MKTSSAVAGSLLLLCVVGCSDPAGNTPKEGNEEEQEELASTIASSTHALNGVMTGVATLTLDLAPPDMVAQAQAGLSIAAALRARAEAVFAQSCSGSVPSSAEVGTGVVVDFGTGCNCPRLGGMVSGSIAVEASADAQHQGEIVVDLQDLTVNGHAVTGTVHLDLEGEALLEVDLEAQTSLGTSIVVSGTATLGVQASAGAGAGASAGASAGANAGVGIGIGIGAGGGVDVDASGSLDAEADAEAGGNVGINVNVAVGVGGGVSPCELTFGGQVGVVVGSQTSILAVAGLHFGAGSCYPDHGTITAQVEGHVVTAICDSSTAVTGELTIAVDQGNTTIVQPPAGSCGGASSSDSLL